MKRLIIGLLSLLTLSANHIYAQQLGRPFIQTFPPSKYKADGQNWQVAQDSRGMVFVRNNEVLLEYDGVNWKQIPFQGSQFYFFALDNRDVIHVVIDNDFGYVIPNENGDWDFNSLKPQTGYKDNFPFIFRCYYANEKVF